MAVHPSLHPHPPAKHTRLCAITHSAIPPPTPRGNCLQALRASASGLARSSVEAVREVEGLVVRLQLLRQQLMARGRGAGGGDPAASPLAFGGVAVPGYAHPSAGGWPDEGDWGGAAVRDEGAADAMGSPAYVLPLR